jgi:EAL domain-containing protein (putative c-di-GMP-specific phosphodiesterase class I)
MAISLIELEKIQLRSDRDRFVAFAFAAAELLLEVSPDGTIVYAAGAGRAFTGSESGALRGRKIFDLLLPQDRSTASAALVRMRRLGRTDPVLLRLQPGHSIEAVMLSGQTLPGAGPSANLYLAVTALRPNTSAPTSARREAATGLLAGDDFVAVIGDVLGQGRDDIELELVDIQNLTTSQSSLNEPASAKLMAEIGEFLRSQSINGDLAGQFSEERYGVVRAKTGEGDSSGALAAALEDHLRATGAAAAGLVIEAHSLSLATEGLSKGDATSALRYALHRFAETGARDFASDTLAGVFRDLVQDTVRRINSVKSAVIQEQIEFAFQPIVDFKKRHIHHYEMLARFTEGGSPFETVQFAESTGLIEELDLLVCRRAIDQLIQSREDLPGLAVNLSGRSLESAAFVEVLLQLLPRLGPDRSRLIFEVTESSEITELSRVAEVLAKLRQQGHLICLDDFGTGSASLPYLRAFQVDYIKIDGSYIDKISSSPRDQVLLKAILAMAQQLSVSTIAEKVETESQAGMLFIMGAGFGQGYLFGKPAALPTTTRLGPADMRPAPAPPKSPLRTAARRRGVQSW